MAVTPQAQTGSAERRALAAVTARSSARASARKWKWAAVGVGLIALAAIAFGVRENRRNTGLAAAGAAADGRADSLAAQLVVRDSLLTVAAKRDELLSVLAAPDRHELPLFGPDPARGRLIASQGRAVITGAGLASLSADSTYAFWLENDSGFRLLADLGDARDGRVLAGLPDDAFLVGWAALTITVERKPPDSLPQGEVLLEYRGWMR
jgi:hypothetical protein